VRGEIYFKEIVSNTRIDLYHSSFTHLVCEFLISLQIYSYIYIYRYISIYCFYLSHLFVLLIIIKSVCYSYLLNHKSKILKYIQ